MNSDSPHLEYVELMLERTLGNRILAKTLFEKLFIALPCQLEDLSETLNKQNFAKAKRVIHDIQGVVGNCGLINLEYYAQRIDAYLSVEDLENAQENFRILQEQTRCFIECGEEILVALEIP